MVKMIVAKLVGVGPMLLLASLQPKSVRAGCNCAWNDRNCQDDCKLKKTGGITQELTCKFKVTKGQMLSVNNPAILQVDIGENCPRDVKGLIHDNSCKDCAAHHLPCGGQFTACSGCCHVDVPKREHRCRDVKSYYLQKNHCDVSLREETATEDDNSDPDVGFQVEDHVNDSFYHGELSDECDIAIDRVECGKVPAVVDFHCDPCNIGSALLLKKCCDECVKFSESDQLKNFPGVRAFVACQGCQAKTINWEGGNMDWKWAGEYDHLSRDAMDYNMEKWIEENVCTLFEPSNPKCQRRLRSANSTEDSAEDLVCSTTTPTTTADSTTTVHAVVTDPANVHVPTTVDVSHTDSAVPSASAGLVVFLALLITSP